MSNVGMVVFSRSVFGCYRPDYDHQPQRLQTKPDRQTIGLGTNQPIDGEVREFAHEISAGK
jgi:hypothetical protein